ncbi:hypothetical protein ACIQUY_02455 [Streptomyces sp. NPDC090231]|uniref:hypothetical protein n=1 Tax=unclassified Streptomyces TaxID=2593676 RepID=UPI002E29CCEB|nr:hypothetical protein [Streptomyces sp. NBC_00304]
MDIGQAVAQMGNSGEFPGISSAWKWSPNPRFVFSLALSLEGDRAYQMNTLDSFDEELVRAVLEFSRHQRIRAEPEVRQFSVATGFAHAGYEFDSVAAVPPSIHGYYAGRDESLNDSVVAVFPAYHYEFSGNETAEEAAYRFKRMLRPTVMSRGPSPYLRMRYENRKTGGGSAGSTRGFATPDILLREIDFLEGAPGSFVEFENFCGEVWRIEWDGAWVINGERRGVVLSEDWVMTSLGC